MTTTDPQLSILVQTREPPMTGVDAVKDHALAIRGT